MLTRPDVLIPSSLATDLVAAGLIFVPPSVQFVFGVRHGLPARRDALEFEVAKLRDLPPGAIWTGAASGRAGALGVADRRALPRGAGTPSLTRILSIQCRARWAAEEFGMKG
jgi:hypothetical protein